MTEKEITDAVIANKRMMVNGEETSVRVLFYCKKEPRLMYCVAEHEDGNMQIFLVSNVELVKDEGVKE